MLTSLIFEHKTYQNHSRKERWIRSLKWLMNIFKIILFI